MSKDEIKYEINKVLDQLSDKSLQEILYLLKGAQVKNSGSIFKPEAINQILLDDKELLKKILEISLNRNSKRGRQPFIMLLGNTNCKAFSEDIISQLNDKFVYGHVIDSIYKMRVNKYVKEIVQFCSDETTWIRNTAKKYIEKYGQS